MQGFSKFPGIRPLKVGLINTILTVVVVFTTACSQTVIENKNDSIPAINDNFPRLIITNQNIDDFVKNAETSHKHLYEFTIQLADDFIEEEPPKAQNAHNKYRRIGESLPSLGLAYLLTKDDRYLGGAEKWIRALLDVETGREVQILAGLLG